jgi:peptidoglycan/xylan/chitin deacetylase (PgdA/CDA1 family)
VLLEPAPGVVVGIDADVPLSLGQLLDAAPARVLPRHRSNVPSSASGRCARLALVVVRSVATEEHVVALTFDDGPSRPWTELVLEALAALDIRATFFVQCAAVDDETSALVVRTVGEGHEIGNHTQSHLGYRFATVGELLDGHRA